MYVAGKFSAGEPQGSVLYVLFVNDLPEVVHGGHGPAQGVQVDHQTAFNMYCAKCRGVCCYVNDSTYTLSSSSPVELTASLSAQFMKLTT